MAAKPKLTPAQVATIEAALAKDTPPTNADLARLYGVDPSVISHIKRGTYNRADASARAVSVAGGDGVQRLSWARIAPSPLNPRKSFDADALSELADSIAHDGLLENLVVRLVPGDDGKHALIAGERRWRAIGLLVEQGRWPADKAVPCLLKDVDDADHIRLAIVENLQRRDVSALEEADGLSALAATGLGTDAIAEAIGVTRRYVQQALKLGRDLVPEARAALAAGQITKTQARVLITAPPDRQRSALPTITGRSSETDVAHTLRVGLRAVDDVAQFAVDPTGPNTTMIGGQPYIPAAEWARRQQAEAERIADDLRADGWATVEIAMGYSETGVTWKYDETARTDTPAEGAAIVWISSQTDAIKVLTGLVAKSAAPTDTAPQPSPEQLARQQRTADRDQFADDLAEAVATRPALALSLLIVNEINDEPFVDWRRHAALRINDHDGHDPLSHIAPLLDHDYPTMARLCPGMGGEALARLAHLPPDDMLDRMAEIVAGGLFIPHVWNSPAELSPTLTRAAHITGVPIPDCLRPAQIDLEEAITETSKAAE